VVLGIRLVRLHLKARHVWSHVVVVVVVVVVRCACHLRTKLQIGFFANPLCTQVCDVPDRSQFRLLLVCHHLYLCSLSLSVSLCLLHLLVHCDANALLCFVVMDTDVPDKPTALSPTSPRDVAQGELVLHERVEPMMQQIDVNSLPPLQSGTAEQLLYWFLIELPECPRCMSLCLALTDSLLTDSDTYCCLLNCSCHCNPRLDLVISFTHEI
jgi:hypothetical protein